MNWKLFKKRLDNFLKEGKQFSIVVIERHKIWIGSGIMALFILSIIFFQDGIELWKKASAPGPIAEPDERQIEDVSAREEDSPEEDQVREVVIEDISQSHRHIVLGTELQRINEPVAFGDEIMYSGGHGGNIEDQAILTELFIYNMNSGVEETVAESGIKFGEIYEGRFNEKWVAWLDTNHVGTNIIYGMNRETGEIVEIKSCQHNRPQLRLWGDDLIWVEQGDLESDSLYLYNFVSGEPVVLEVFDNSTYGTCPPDIWGDAIVWAAPGENGDSIIKRLDLNMGEDIASDGTGEEHIDPKGFAIYPSTNGKAIAWIDNLDPKKATLKLTLDGEEIIEVDEGVGRFFGVGNNFVGYTKGNDIMVYLWEEERYAHINPKGVDGRLSPCSIREEYIIWYSNPPKESQDIVNISTIE